jgi:hypothetical protein
MDGMRARKQIAFLPESVDDHIGRDNPVGVCRRSSLSRRNARWDGDRLYEVPRQHVRFEAATEAMDRLDLIRGAVSLGDVETLISHPAGVGRSEENTRARHQGRAGYPRSTFATIGRIGRQ